MRFVETDRLLSCVHCGLCLPSCPTYLETGTEADSPRGRILLMRALEEGRLSPDAEVISHLDGCLGCRACETACPSGVRFGSLIEAARPFIESHRPWPKRLARRGLLAMLTRRTLRNLLALMLRPLAGTDRGRQLARTFQSRWLGYAAALQPVPPSGLPRRIEPDGAPRGTALLLTGCIADTAFGGTGAALARLLAKAGVRVLIPENQGCCGALALHLGVADRARSLAEKLAAMAGGMDVDWIVPTAAGCGALLRDYHELMPDNPDARKVAPRVRDALALLAELGLPPAIRPIPHTVAVHDACHLAHGQGIRAEVRTVLASIPGIRLVELAESDVCCGSAGTYNLTEPAMAERLLARKLASIRQSGAEIIAAANPGCLLQIRSGAIVRDLGVEVAHPIDLLARAHALAGAVEPTSG